LSRCFLAIRSSAAGIDTRCARFQDKFSLFQITGINACNQGISARTQQWPRFAGCGPETFARPVPSDEYLGTVDNNVQEEENTMTNRSYFGVLLATLTLLAASIPALAQDSDRMVERIAREVRRELVMLPFYNLFDNFTYKVSPDGVVTLMGQVTRPTLKTDSERVVEKIEGVTNVVNEVEVLPLSRMDDQIRLATYRAIYGHSALQPLALRAVPPIHIIVKNGNVTLEGIVNRKMEKQIAETQARQVPNVFKVTNNLRVEQEESGNGES
jgi:hyperosmotically inducible periplasmic protein